MRVRGGGSKWEKITSMHKDKTRGEMERVEGDEGKRFSDLHKSHGQLMQSYESEGKVFFFVSPEVW